MASLPQHSARSHSPLHTIAAKTRVMEKKIDKLELISEQLAAVVTSLATSGNSGMACSSTDATVAAPSTPAANTTTASSTTPSKLPTKRRRPKKKKTTVGAREPAADILATCAATQITPQANTVADVALESPDAETTGLMLEKVKEVMTTLWDDAEKEEGLLEEEVTRRSEKGLGGEVHEACEEVNLTIACVDQSVAETTEMAKTRAVQEALGVADFDFDELEREEVRRCEHFAIYSDNEEEAYDSEHINFDSLALLACRHMLQYETSRGSRDARNQLLVKVYADLEQACETLNITLEKVDLHYALRESLAGAITDMIESACEDDVSPQDVNVDEVLKVFEEECVEAVKLAIQQGFEMKQGLEDEDQEEEKEDLAGDDVPGAGSATEDDPEIMPRSFVWNACAPAFVPGTFAEEISREGDFEAYGDGDETTSDSADYEDRCERESEQRKAASWEAFDAQQDLEQHIIDENKAEHMLRIAKQNFISLITVSTSRASAKLEEFREGIATAAAAPNVTLKFVCAEMVAWIELHFADFIGSKDIQEIGDRKENP